MVAWSLPGFQTDLVTAFPGNHTILYMKRAGIPVIPVLSLSKSGLIGMLILEYLNE